MVEIAEQVETRPSRYVSSEGYAETKALAVAQVVEYLLAFMAREGISPGEVERVCCDLTTRVPDVDPVLETATLGIVLRETGPTKEPGDSTDG